MDKPELDSPKTIITEISGFVPMFDAVIEQYTDHTRAAVHGAVWRFCQMEDGVCKASLETIGAWIGVNKATVQRHMEVLVADGYFADLTPELVNRPHVYADTGKVVMKGSLKAHVAQRNVTVAQRNAGVAESRLSKDSNKDSKNGAGAPLEGAGLDWKLGHGQAVTEADLNPALQKHKQMVDSANLVGMNCGVFADQAYALALAFQEARDIVFAQSKCKGQAKAAKSLIEQAVQPEHVSRAVKKLMDAGLTCTDLYSVERTAVDFANQPAPVKTKIVRYDPTEDQPTPPPAWVTAEADRRRARMAGSK